MRQLLRITAAEKVVEERMILGYDNDQVDLVVFGELGNCILEIIHSDEIKFRIEFGKHFLHFCSFGQELFRERYIMLIVHIYDMQIGLKELQYGFNRQHGCTAGNVFEISCTLGLG